MTTNRTANHVRLFRLEHKREPLLNARQFSLRLAANIAAATAFITLSLVAGMVGYRYLEKMEWIDAFANSAMLLSGMGPLAQPATWWGKLFAGVYALYCGLVAILSAGLILTPIVHRAIHRFHLAEEA